MKYLILLMLSIQVATAQIIPLIPSQAESQIATAIINDIVKHPDDDCIYIGIFPINETKIEVIVTYYGETAREQEPVTVSILNNPTPNTQEPDPNN